MDEGLTGDAVSEFLGAFTVTFVAAGSIVADEGLASPTSEGFGVLGVALATGLAYAVATHLTAARSGGHVNPAVSIAAWLTGRVSPTKAGAYVLAQVAGGLVAATLLVSLAPDDVLAAASHGATVVAPRLSPLTALTWEILLTFLYGLTVFRAVLDSERPELGAFAVAVPVVALVLVGHGFTGASMNPARSIGPAVWEGAWRGEWIYLAGPVLGAALAGGVHDWVLEGEE